MKVNDGAVRIEDLTAARVEAGGRGSDRDVLLLTRVDRSAARAVRAGVFLLTGVDRDVAGVLRAVTPAGGVPRSRLLPPLRRGRCAGA